MKNNKKYKRIIVALVVIISLLICIIPIDNFSLDVDEYKIKSAKLSESFDGFKIAQISDYHNRKSKVVNNSIINSLLEKKPDIIVVTGDLVDCTHTDVDAAVNFIKRLIEIAPVYMILGNHEANLSKTNKKEFEKLINELLSLNVNILRNSFAVIKNKKGESFNLYGIDDPYFYESGAYVSEITFKLCEDLHINRNNFNVLLAHHPEEFENYWHFGFDLIFSGHAHGGQVTLFGKAIIAPDQGFFPMYTQGQYSEGSTNMLLSRGIGYSIIPFRLFCRPNIIISEFIA